MALTEVGRPEVEAALKEFDELGREAFLASYAFGTATTYLLKFEGRLYDPKAIVGVAHRYTAGGEPLKASEFDATAALDRLRALGLEVVPFSGLWWVNQGASYKEERDRGYVWAPTHTKAGFSVSHHTDVAKLRPGQLVISYSDRFIRAIGVVAGEPYEATRPAGLSQDLWTDNGILCPIDWAVLDHPIARTDIPDRDAAAGPFDRDGNVKQGYLYRVADRHTLPLLEFLISRHLDVFAPPITHPHLERGAPVEPKGDHDALRQLVNEFLAEGVYPPGRGNERDLERRELADGLSEAALSSPNLPLLRRLAGPSYGSPGPQPGFNVALQTPEATARLVETLRFLLYGPGTVEERLEDCLSGSHKIHAIGEAMLVKALAVTNPSRWIPCYPTGGKVGKLAVLSALDQSRPTDVRSAAVLAARTNDQLRTMLDPYFPNDPWGMQEFGWWLLHREQVPVQGLDDLASELYLPVEFLERIALLLEDRGQVVFYGPPGTGKTYVARKLAGYVARGGGTVEKIQFHVSYSYEDFVEGYRPRLTDSGQVTYEIVDGPIKRLAAQARERPDVTHVLLIDELNRANVSRVLGELLFLLEYRDEEIRLQYSDVPFSLPENLKIIATMNTADRSIALVDAALRRRFHFVPFFPDRAPVNALLRDWLADHKPDLMWVADVVDRANTLLGDRNLAIGPSHFLTKELSLERVDLIWANSVLPFIEEQLLHDPGRIEQFALGRLRSTTSKANTNQGDDLQPDPRDAELDATE